MSQSHAIITDEMLARLRERIGKEWRPEKPWFNELASRDAIRHFAHGIGDDNPLWCDAEYARHTRWGGIIAPPGFLNSVYWPIGTWGGLPGIHAFHSGNDWEWSRPVYEDDRISFSETLTDVLEKSSRYARRIVIQVSETAYRNQREEVVARAKGWCVRAERGAAREMGKYAHISRYRYTPEELRRIEQDYEREERRGAKPRYWEEVQVGEELAPVVKGPLSVRDIIAWSIGAGSYFLRAHRLAVDYRRRHPGVAMAGTEDVPELVHFEDSPAQEISIGAAYDYGPQRVSWLSHLLTNWMGDDAFLKRLYVELRRFNLIGDTTWCQGKVTRRYREGDKFLVDLDIWAENQRGEVTAPGRATVLLPSREKGLPEVP